MMPPLLTIEDLMDILGIKKSTAYTLKRKDNWPHVLVGSKVRFTEEQLVEIVRMYTKTPQQPTQRAPRIGTRARRNK